jgi:hypothetical protein
MAKESGEKPYPAVHSMKYYGTRPHLNGILTLLSVGTNQRGILILLLQSIQNSPSQAERLRGHAMKLLAACRAALQTLGAVRQSHGIQQEMSRIAQSAAHRLRLVRARRLRLVRAHRHRLARTTYVFADQTAYLREVLFLVRLLTHPGYINTTAISKGSQHIRGKWATVSAASPRSKFTGGLRPPCLPVGGFG